MAKVVRASLEKPDEPDYDAIAAGYEAALEELMPLLDSKDPIVASRVVYVAAAVSRGSKERQPSDERLERASQIVEAGSHHEDPIVRVAAAIAAASIPLDRGTAISARLCRDPDEGVRASALEGVPEALAPELVEAIGDIAAGKPPLATMAQELLEHHPRL